MKHISCKTAALAALALGVCSDPTLARPAGPGLVQGGDVPEAIDSADRTVDPGSVVMADSPARGSADSPGLAGPGALSAAALGLAGLGLLVSLRRKRMEH